MTATQAPTPGPLSGDEPLNVLLDRAVAAFKALPPEEQRRQFDEQKKSWVAAEMAWGDEGTRLCLAPTAPVEASGSEREVPWLTDDECDEVGKLRFALAMKVYRMSSDLRQNLRPQPSGETRADESLDDVARRLFAAQYPGRDYDDLKDMVQIGWLRKAHDEILSARANPSPTPAADADRGMKAFNFINDLYRIKAEFPAIRLHGALKKAEALAALKSTAAKEGGE